MGVANQNDSWPGVIVALDEAPAIEDLREFMTWSSLEQHALMEVNQKIQKVVL
jgi:hypothetical protein